MMKFSLGFPITIFRFYVIRCVKNAIIFAFTQFSKNVKK